MPTSQLKNCTGATAKGTLYAAAEKCFFTPRCCQLCLQSVMVLLLTKQACLCLLLLHGEFFANSDFSVRNLFMMSFALHNKKLNNEDFLKLNFLLEQKWVKQADAN